jgi:hypothetical protein
MARFTSENSPPIILPPRFSPAKTLPYESSHPEGIFLSAFSMCLKLKWLGLGLARNLEVV